MTFMHEGGLAMWLTLALFGGATVTAILRRERDGARIALAGAVATIASGLAGFSTGLYRTVAHVGELEAVRQADVLGVGLRESVNNTLFAAVLAFALSILALALRAKTSARAPA